jgi:hypothetical protein
MNCEHSAKLLGRAFGPALFVSGNETVMERTASSASSDDVRESYQSGGSAPAKLFNLVNESLRGLALIHLKGFSLIIPDR